MDAFSLLRYWKGGGGNAKLSVSNTVTPTTIVAAVHDEEESLSDGGDGDGDDGPFFDLEFAVPADVDETEREEEEEVELRQKVEKREAVINEIDEEEVEKVVQNLSFSPSDDLFFKGEIHQIDGSDATETEEVSKSGAPLSLVKSAAKLRVFMLGLKRSKSESNQYPPENTTTNNSNNIASSKCQSNKFLTVTLRMEDVKMPIISLLTRASSNSKLKNNNNNGGAADTEPQQKRESDVKAAAETVTTPEACGENEKRNRKEVVQRYLKMVKIHRKNSRETTEEKEDKAVATGDKMAERKSTAEVAAAAGRKGVKQVLSLKAVIAKKHLGKSKSAVVHSMPNNNHSNNNNNTTASKKRDDSLLQQQDGIQSAILHCKRSFNSSSSSSSEDGEDTTSASDPSHEKNVTVAAVEEAAVQSEEDSGVVTDG